jgi:GDP-4-dehydro-6-deoxy-D-mannose reductase
MKTASSRYNVQIGSYVTRELVDRGYEVHGILRYRTHYGNLVGLMDTVTWHKGDITDAFFVRRVLDAVKPDFIYHFAAQSLNGISVDTPGLTMDVNVQGTLNFLEALRAQNATNTKFMHAGSSTAYGKTAETWDGPIPEDAPLLPATVYGVSKVASEMLARQYYYSHGIHTVTARFFQQVAPGGPETLAVQDFCKQVAMMEAGLQSPVLRHGALHTLR